MYMNYSQNKMLHALLGKLGMMEVKADLVWSYTEARTTSSREMTTMEAANLLRYLKSIDPAEAVCEKMRRKIIAKAHKMRWETAQGKADMPRVDNWCLKYGGFGKKLNQHTQAELVKLVTQFDNMYRKFVNQF